MDCWIDLQTIFFNLGENLQSICRQVIMLSIKESDIYNLPLPPALKDYLQFS